MTAFHFLVLGIVQGITEFLPISSSGHLVLFQNLFQIKDNVIFLDVVLHSGTLCAVVFFFRHECLDLLFGFLSGLFDSIAIWSFAPTWRRNEQFRLSVYILLVTLVTGAITIKFKAFFEQQFESAAALIIPYLVTGTVLFLTKKCVFGQRQLEHINAKDAFILGLAQSVSVIPGVSRSGMTISTFLFRNVDADGAFRFSFFVSIPVILGAFVIACKDLHGTPLTIPFGYLMLGFFASFIMGLFAMALLRMIMRNKYFYRFAYYCFAMAALLFVLKIKNFI